ncbi:hypothetical protein FPOA_01803 [Fusarium poae]|uniref:Manganese transporter n=1 Tax=Fusarium poae TaxID=36050 RepID=A0A1B8B569_FUSPO|nr:hypothetical protein FPOA_01803 [Fusarium poae]
MNKTSHTDEPYEGDDGYNQSPNIFSNDLTTNENFNGLINARAMLQSDDQLAPDKASNKLERVSHDLVAKPAQVEATPKLAHASTDHGQPPDGGLRTSAPATSPVPAGDADDGTPLQRFKKMIVRIGSFVGPGFMISVAYIDPGNYSTDIAAGASYRFRLLFVVLLSNIFAIFLQSLAIKLGTVSGLNLAQACRAFLPRWLNYTLYILAEAAIIATDIAEVIGFAIALNLLAPKVPLVAGCAISIVDVMVLLIFYRPEGSMKSLRYFEIFIMLLVLGVVVCFCIQLSLIRDTSPGEVFKGYLPSKSLIEAEAIYQACGILGATVMPHSLYLGSGIVRRITPVSNVSSSSSVMDKDADKGHFVPSEKAIKLSLKFSILDLAVSLFTFALFVNSAILIVAGASLYGDASALGADIFGIHGLLSQSISPAAGTIFALALLLSGVSAGIVCTIAGQMVSEGSLNWKVKPWVRRLMVRSISITPSIIIAGAVGRSGLNAALNGSQVALSVILPFVTAPLIYFTARDKYMTVRASGSDRNIVEGNGMTNDMHGEEAGMQPEDLKMANSWFTTIIAILVWLFMAVMNVANLVFLGK